MKAWFSLLLLLIAAVVMALVLREHSGNVIIMAQPWRIELSLTLAVLLLLAAFIALHLALRLLGWIAAGPGRFRLWRSLRAQQRDSDLLEAGWIDILEGRYPQAEKHLSKLLRQSRSQQRRVLASLALARARRLSGEVDKLEASLTQAREDAQGDIRLQEAAAVVAAETWLGQRQAARAVTLLQPLQDASTPHFHATRLLLEAHHQLGDHDRVYELTRLLMRRSALSREAAMAYLDSAVSARLQAGGVEQFKVLWGELKSEERVLPAVALVGARLQAAQDQHDEAAKTLEAALQASWREDLLLAYAQCPPAQVGRRLGKAEAWLKQHDGDAALLAALGRLCLTGELWGQAEHYLQRSLALRPALATHALLGTLYDRLGRPDDAALHWRLSSGQTQAMPTLEARTSLPAADTRSDPGLVDGLPAMSEPAVATPPVAASVADYLVETAPAEAQAAPPAAKAPPARPAQGEFDDYFDSAPIPGVDLTQTSDRPSPGGRS